MGIEILPPDINESPPDFAVVEGGIRFGLGAVKNVGLKAIESVIEERNQGGPFKGLVDFCTRVDGSKPMLCSAFATAERSTLRTGSQAR
jgi:DNA polymerase-3 subunit alpha